MEENELRKYFADFGTVAEIDVQSDKGQAFITFGDHDSVDRCVSKKHTVSFELQLGSKLATAFPENISSFRLNFSLNLGLKIA